MTEPEKLKLSNVLWGVVIPVLVGVLIIALPVLIGPGLSHVLGAASVVPIIFTFGLANMVVLSVPLVVGLLWNRFAGGAAGFLMGSIYYVASAGLYTAYYASKYNFFSDVSMLGYIVNAMLIGYIAGSLNNHSFKFKRMLGSSLTAAVITGLIQFYLNTQIALPVARSMAPVDLNTFLLSVGGMIPMLIIGFVIPIIAKVMTWYGIYPGGHS